ncbi:hypothetical protein [Nocardia terpenica]|uniref:Uncharacterized protein n=1 Tax=Nocardia terpenica TaxID=455432 RepID=A0A6G9Z9N6_9NOCA|nr:hypothetical protein [Nocardia terpenica]QIS22111.1 hypothetical protein F6W96_30960 [Nocardia terpenica]
MTAVHRYRRVIGHGAVLTALAAVGVVASLGTPVAPQAAADGQATVHLAPERVAPGAKVTISTKACHTAKATAESKAFARPASLTTRTNRLEGMGVVRSNIKPGQYTVRVECAQRSGSATGTLTVTPQGH